MTTRQTGPFRRSPLVTLWILCALGAGALGSTVVFTQGRQGGARGGGAAAWPPKCETPAAGQVEVLPVQGQIYMIVGAGANITVQAGDAGVLVVDAGTAPMADKVLAAIRTISKKPLRIMASSTSVS